MFHRPNRPAERSPGQPTASSDAETVQASITDTAPCEKSLRVRVKRDGLAPVRAVVLAEFQKDATVPGFRKGKVPAERVERQFAKAIHDETLHRATKQALAQVAQSHDLKPVGPFELKAANFSETDGLTLEATVEVEPSFALAEYRGIPLSRASGEVTPEEMAGALAKLQESMAQLVPAGEGKPKERQVPPVDDELAKDLGFESLGKLQGHVKAKLSEQKRAALAQQTESALYDELLERHAFEVPPRLVSHQTERLTRDFKVRLLLSGMSEEQADQEAGKFTEQLRTSAQRHVKLGFILERIAAKESLAVAQHELVDRLWQLSQRWKKDPAEVRKHFDAQGLWPSVVSTIRQEKTTAWLLSVAVVRDASSSSVIRSP